MLLRPCRRRGSAEGNVYSRRGCSCMLKSATTNQIIVAHAAQKTLPHCKETPMRVNNQDSPAPRRSLDVSHWVSSTKKYCLKTGRFFVEPERRMGIDSFTPFPRTLFIRSGTVGEFSFTKLKQGEARFPHARTNHYTTRRRIPQRRNPCRAPIPDSGMSRFRTTTKDDRTIHHNLSPKLG